MHEIKRMPSIKEEPEDDEAVNRQPMKKDRHLSEGDIITSYLDINQTTRFQDRHDDSRRNSQEIHQKWTFYLIFCNLTIVLGSGFLFGYNVAVFNGPHVIIAQWLNQTFEQIGDDWAPEQLETQWSLAVALYLIGGVIGSTWFPTILSSARGKRNALIAAAFIGFCGEIMLFISRFTANFVPLMVGRAVVGFHGGVSMVVGPALIIEHAPARLRGACGTFFSLGIAVGFSVAHLLGLNFILGTDGLWNYLFLVAAGIYFVHVIGLFFVVESPRWLVDRNKDEIAIAALMKLRGANAAAVRPEFDQTKLTASHATGIEKVSLGIVFKNRQLWWPMVVTIVLHLNNQLTGISAAFLCARLVMKDAGIDQDTSAFVSLGLTFCLIIGNIFCAAVIDRIGRRRLMLASTAGIAVVNIFLVFVLAFDIFEAVMAGLALFLLLFACGSDPIAWFMPAEMFDRAARPIALAVGMFTNWSCNIVVTLVFPIVAFELEFYCFLAFAVIALLNFVFFLFYLPETTPHLADYSTELFAPGNSLSQLRRHSQTTTPLRPADDESQRY